MTTQDIAEHLAAACARFPALGRVTAADLLAMVKGELGHEEILDRFCCYHGFHPEAERKARVLQFSRAIPPRAILHVCAGAGYAAAIHSVLCGLLLRAHNLCVLPPRGLREVAEFRDALPAQLANEIEIHDRLPDDWIDAADAVVVLGTDEAIARFRKMVRPHQIFVARPQKIALAIVLDDRDYATVPLAARDVSLHDQQNPISPHVVYVAQGRGLDARAYAARLAVAMEEFHRHTPARPLAQEHASFLNNLRTSYRFRIDRDPTVALWESKGSTAWTVIYEQDPAFALSPLGRTVFVKPLPQNPSSVLLPIRRHVAAIGIAPSTMENAERLAQFGTFRVCPLGRMTSPPITWHRDTAQSIAPLVRWLDFEPGDPPSSASSNTPPPQAQTAAQDELFAI